MRLAQLTASTAALLLSSTALLAQQGATANESVFLDVGGTPILVPVAVATEACNLDEAGVQQASQSRVEQSGLDDATVRQLFAATGPAGATDEGNTDSAVAGSDGTGTATAGQSGDTAGAGIGGTAGASPGTLGAGTNPTSTADATNTPAPGGEPVNVEELSSSTNMAASDNAATDMDGVLEGAETTAADSTAIPDTDTSAAQGLDSGAASNEQLLTLAVCQVDITRAGELGVGGAGVTGTDASGG